MIIPAIDLIDGSVVRLYQGDYEQKTKYEFEICLLQSHDFGKQHYYFDSF